MCVGRLGASPEGRLAAAYAERASATGRRCGLGPVEIREIEVKRGGPAAEGSALLAACAGMRLVACDRRGVAMTSRQLAVTLAQIRDAGCRGLALVVGGAEGLNEQVISAAAQTLSFGPQTWPHALARVMLAEQVYRAATIDLGLPYHRE